MRSRLILPAALAMLAACSSQPAEDKEAPPSPAPVLSDPDFGQPGALDAQDIEQAALDGELGCSFTPAGADAPALVAKGWAGIDKASQGVLKIDGAAMPVHTQEAKGFGAMVRGAQFLGGDLIAVVQPDSADDADPGEGSTYTAQLRITRPSDGRMAAIAGEWTCGP